MTDHSDVVRRPKTPLQIAAEEKATKEHNDLVAAMTGRAPHKHGTGRIPREDEGCFTYTAPVQQPADINTSTHEWVATEPITAEMLENKIASGRAVGALNVEILCKPTYPEQYILSEKSFRLSGTLSTINDERQVVLLQRWR